MKMFVKSQKQGTYVIHFTRVESKDLPKDTRILWGNICKCHKCWGNCKLAALHHPSLIGLGFWSPHSHLNANNFMSCLKAEINYSFSSGKTTWVTAPVCLSLWFGDESWEGGAGILRAPNFHMGDNGLWCITVYFRCQQNDPNSCKKWKLKKHAKVILFCE